MLWYGEQAKAVLVIRAGRETIEGILACVHVILVRSCITPKPECKTHCIL